MNICIVGTFRSAVVYKVMTKCTAHLKCRMTAILVATPINNHVRPRGHAGRNSLPLSLPLPSPLFPPLSPPLLTCLVSVLLHYHVPYNGYHRVASSRSALFTILSIPSSPVYLFIAFQDYC